MTSCGGTWGSNDEKKYEYFLDVCVCTIALVSVVARDDVVGCTILRERDHLELFGAIKPRHLVMCYVRGDATCCANPNLLLSFTNDQSYRLPVEHER